MTSNDQRDQFAPDEQQEAVIEDIEITATEGPTAGYSSSNSDYPAMPTAPGSAPYGYQQAPGAFQETTGASETFQTPTGYQTDSYAQADYTGANGQGPYQQDTYRQTDYNAAGQPYQQQTYQESYGPGAYQQYPQGYAQQAVPFQWSRRSKLAAGLFGILLGAFGVHNFYLGFTGKAVAQLLITVLSLGMLSFVSAIWGLIEGILVLASATGSQWDLDADGLPMKPIASQ